MIRITNLLNQPRCFTLDEETSLRLTPYGIREIKKSQITRELENNQRDGLIDIQIVEIVKVSKEEEPKEDKKPKK